MGILKDKIAFVMGAGQTPGTTIGNGRATAIQMAREGATVWCVDRDLESAQETADIIHSEGFAAHALHADLTDESSIEKAVSSCVEVSARIDILHNNVGISVNDSPVEAIESSAYDLIYTVNLRGMALTCKHVLPIMRAQESGVVINVSSAAALSTHLNVAYKTTKAGVIALSQNLAVTYAPVGIRSNCIIPGVIETPMAVEGLIKKTGKSREEIIATRHARVPLRGSMGTAWDIAQAAAFLSSDKAKFITGVCLPVDGGQLAFVGR